MDTRIVRNDQLSRTQPLGARRAQSGKIAHGGEAGSIKDTRRSEESRNLPEFHCSTLFTHTELVKNGFLGSETLTPLEFPSPEDRYRQTREPLGSFASLRSHNTFLRSQFRWPFGLNL